MGDTDMTDKTGGAAITPDGIRVQKGQVWRDLDKRMRGRTVVVEWVSPDGTVARVKGAHRTKLLIRRMYRCSTGWELVK
jgi:hypothetical protein